MLAVQVDEQPADLGEDRGAHGAAVDPRARATGGGDLALQHDERLLRVDAALVEQRGDLRPVADVEDAFDRRAIGAGANQVRAGALAEQQAERADDDRLARTRLAGQHVESARERQRERFDDGEVPDAQLGQHRVGSSRSERPPQCSFSRIVEKKLCSGKRTIDTGCFGATHDQRLALTEGAPDLPVHRDQKLVGAIVRVQRDHRRWREARAGGARACAR